MADWKVALVATENFGLRAAAIGGGTVLNSSVQYVSAGEITVNGGTVTASCGRGMIGLRQNPVRVFLL